MSAQQRPVLSVVLVNLEGFFCVRDNCLIPEASRGEAATVSVSTFAGSPLLSPNPHLAPRVKIWNSEFESISHIFDSLQEITPSKSTKAMQEIWLLTDPQWIRHSCSIWGGWVKRTKGLQRFKHAVFFGKGVRCKTSAASFVEFHSGLCDASYRTDKSWTAGLFPFTWECARGKKIKNNFFFLLAHISTTYRGVPERFTSILGRVVVGHSWRRKRRRKSPGVKVTPIWGNWAGGLAGARGGGSTGCWWGAGSPGMGVIWLRGMWPGFSFPAGLSTLRAQCKGSMPLIPVMPTCLKPSHLLPTADTRPDGQSDLSQRPQSHRRPLAPRRPCLMAERWHGVSAAAPNKALSLLLSDLIPMHIKDVCFRMTWGIMIIGRRAATLTLKGWRVWIWRAGMEIESLGNMLIERGLNKKSTLVQSTSAKNFLHKIFTQIIILILKLFNLSQCWDFQFPKEMLIILNL